MKSGIHNYLARAAFLAVAALVTPHARAAPGGSLDGATGTLCKVDMEHRCFELLKETEYDPKTNLATTRRTPQTKSAS